jgi:hypothetical protein
MCELHSECNELDFTIRQSAAAGSILKLDCRLSSSAVTSLQTVLVYFYGSVGCMFEFESRICLSIPISDLGIAEEWIKASYSVA